MIDIEVVLKNSAEEIEKALDKYYNFVDKDYGALIDSQKYSLLGGGKRIRPYIAMEFCRLFGGKKEAVEPFACALEMIHTYSLIHDDLPCMDNAELRRGKPSSHKVFGETMALLSGDALLTFAFETIASNAYVSKDIIVSAVAEIAKAAGTCGMVGGQVMDTCSNGDFDFDTLLKLHSLKTGALIKASACLGCLAANVDMNDERMADALCYAENVGLAFQITDDILDLDGDVNMTGKNSGSDKKENKTTFMTFCSSTQARQYAKDLTDAAIDAIEKYEGNENLVSLARYLLVRNK